MDDNQDKKVEGEESLQDSQLGDEVLEMRKHYTLFDVTNVAVLHDGTRAICFDGRYNSILIIEGSIDGDGNPKIRVYEPSPTEKEFILLELGLVPEDKVIEIEKKLKSKEQRRELCRILMKEFLPEFQEMAAAAQRSTAIKNILTARDNTKMVEALILSEAKKLAKSKG